ncbi:F0F1 ATP synthase subunit A [bacterium]|nr:F0F1 ATP synthase subunit A [bacterium]
MLHITFYPEYVARIGSFMVSNTLFCSWITSILLVFLAFLAKKRLKKIPSSISLQNIFEALFEWMLKFINSITGSPKLTKRVFPLIMTFFLFIVCANFLGIIPGFLGAFFVNVNGKSVSLFRSPNSDWNTTLALAIISVFSIQWFGVKMLGFKNYLKRFFNFANPVRLFLGFFEIISDFTKVLSLSLRLFGNILAGEILLIAVAFFVPYFIPLPFMILELFVGVIQAFIFATLSLVFIKSSETEYFKDKKVAEIKEK